MAERSRRRAVFLDRDGVLNRADLVAGVPTPPNSVEALELLDGVEEACRRLRAAGLLLIGATNQPDIARGKLDASAVAAINDRVRSRLALDDLLTCPHDDSDGCACRKPQPGMLLAAADRWGIDLSGSVMVGDSWRDVLAGRAAGCGTVLIDTWKDARAAEQADRVAGGLGEAVDWILWRTGTGFDPEEMPPVSGPAGLRVKIFADGADEAGIAELARNPVIRGFTTNPTLMRAAGVTDYEAFARRVLELIPGRPISFEVFADDFAEMERQARRIAAWGEQVYVKIPITTTTGASSAALLRHLAAEGVKVNVTALMTTAQVETTCEALAGGPSSCISVFAGRIADTGRDPVPLMSKALEIMRPYPQLELIWASPREILNVVQADRIGCHVITVTHELLRKLGSIGRDLDDFSLDTVRMFHRDAQAAGFTL